MVVITHHCVFIVVTNLVMTANATDKKLMIIRYGVAYFTLEIKIKFLLSKELLFWLNCRAFCQKLTAISLLCKKCYLIYKI